MLRIVFIILSVAGSTSLHKMEPFIVGGTPAAMLNHSYSAFLTVQIKDQLIVCGSSILNQHLLLTAAHCLEGVNKNTRIIARAGHAHRLRGFMRHVMRVAMHQSYNTRTIANDIAMVFVRRPFEFSPNITRVSIMKDPPIVNVAYVAGWGLIDEIRETESDYLQRARQFLWSQEECKKVLKKVPDGVLCGGQRHASVYAAEGDSGSALVVNDYIQIGLVSFKRPEISQSIVVYTDVSYFYDWISTTVEKLFCRYNKNKL